MSNLKVNEAFTPHGLFANVIASEAVARALKAEDQYLPLGEFSSHFSREDAKKAVQQLLSEGVFTLDGVIDGEGSEVNWDKVGGIRVKQIALVVEITGNSQPSLEEADKPGKKKKGSKKKPKAEDPRGFDDFTIGLATYRGKVEKLENPEDPATPWNLTIVRLTKFEPETDVVDRFREAGSWPFSTPEGAWAHFDNFKAVREEIQDGLADRFNVPGEGMMALRVYSSEQDGFQGVAGIIHVLSGIATEEADVISEQDCFIFWEAYLDRVAPAGELPEEFSNVIKLPIVDETPKVEEVEIDESTTLYEFDLTIRDIAVSVSVTQVNEVHFKAIYFENNVMQTKKMSVGSCGSETEAKTLAENWLKEVL